LQAANYKPITVQPDVAIFVQQSKRHHDVTTGMRGNRLIES